MSKNVLVINCGSSSVKFALVDAESGNQPITGLAEKIGLAEGMISWKIDGKKETITIKDPTHLSSLEKIIETLKTLGFLNDDLVAVGHRIVHGGEMFKKSVKIDDDVLKAVESVNNLAPLHNPANLTGIRTAMQLLPHLPQVGVFDTAFHQTMPKTAYLYALPYEYYEKHSVRRYGFHGTSHRFVTEKAAKMLGKPLEETALLCAHLGNGSSVAAVLNGKSVDTTMGLTPLEGLVMGTRCGDIDPSIHQYLAHTLNYSIDEITNILNKKSGLLGISGLSNDMRELEDAMSKGDPKATLAIEMFCYKLAKQLAALAVPMGRIDALVFTGGIGENSTVIRSKVINNLKLLNFELDTAKNEVNGKESNGIVTTDNSTVAMVVKTDEEYMIAKDTAELL